MTDWNSDKLRNPALRQALGDVFAGNVAIKPALEDVTPVNGVAATGTLTIDAQVTAGDTMTIGDKVFTFVASGTAAVDGDIDIGDSIAACLLATVAAINGTDGINTPSEFVTAGDFASDDCILTSIVTATAGNAVATTETFTTEANVFADTILGSGVDGTEGTAGMIVADSSYVYVSIAASTVLSGNWRQMTLGSTY